MTFVTNQMLNERKEAGCLRISTDRKYYHTGSSFIKRSLRPREWQVSHIRGNIMVPRQNKERILNEAATLQYLSQRSSVPLPKLICCFEDDDAVYLITEYVEGVAMDDLPESDLETVMKELERHKHSLPQLRSSKIGGLSGLVVPPYRTRKKNLNDHFNLRDGAADEYVFCHNDLAQQNVIVDPETLKIKAILDWEFAGFYPAFFDRAFYKRRGPSAAINGEEDDTDRLVEFLRSQWIRE
ncbi:MAG: hypothetical protein Q9160_006342 [Pyrenula sp. 1 TL-2023]